MKPLLFIVFVVVPLIEIALFVLIGQRIGIGATLALVIITAFVGATFVSRQSRSTWLAVQTDFAAGQFPGAQLAHC